MPRRELFAKRLEYLKYCRALIVPVRHVIFSILQQAKSPDILVIPEEELDHRLNIFPQDQKDKILPLLKKP